MSTVAKVRAKRARELQAAFERAARFQRATRGAVARIVNDWRKIVGPMLKAAERYERAVDGLSGEFGLPAFEVPMPAEMLQNLKHATAIDVADFLASLRAQGRRLAKVKRPRPAERRRAREAMRKPTTMEDLAEAMRNHEKFAFELAKRNQMQRHRGQPELTEDEYRSYLKMTVHRG